MTTNCTIAYPHSHLDTHASYDGPHHRVLDTADLARQMDPPQHPTLSVHTSRTPRIGGRKPEEVA